MKNDSTELTSLILKAKAYWKYPEEWLDAWTLDLKISPCFIENNEVVILSINNESIGFYGLECHSTDKAAYLDHLWVDPKYIGKGYGRMLFELACNKAAEIGHKTMELVADPNAEGFYSRLGAIKIDEVHGKVLDVKRVLPKMEVHLQK
ncbi:GNAT family N-acetyltransferase [Shewanella woodyi]|uniref:GNAT family N-acetyltransferase n=1 Tax=Shewanella woodyi TaxID=60961 RepID=UPI0015F2C00B|nr:GNAT family N-acetyltransferase [Shewanella woodyi]